MNGCPEMCLPLTSTPCHPESLTPGVRLMGKKVGLWPIRKTARYIKVYTCLLEVVNFLESGGAPRGRGSCYTENCAGSRSLICLVVGTFRRGCRRLAISPIPLQGGADPPLRFAGLINSSRSNKFGPRSEPQTPGAAKPLRGDMAEVCSIRAGLTGSDRVGLGARLRRGGLFRFRLFDPGPPE
jgi:hypothetical protein